MARLGQAMLRFALLSLGITLIVLCSGQDARSAHSTRPAFVDDDWDPVWRKQIGGQSGAGYARTDTLFLFAATGPGSFGMPGTTDRGYNFDREDGVAEAAGFVSIDETAQLGNYWHVEDTDLVIGRGTDISAALEFDNSPNEFALWCGAETVCGWIYDTGYGNGWQQWAILETDAWSTSLSLQLKYIADFEGSQADYFQILVEVEDGGDTQLEEIYTNQMYRERNLLDIDLTVIAADYPPTATMGDIYLFFTSDRSVSNEDGKLKSDYGAVWADNIVMTMDGGTTKQTDFAGGILPNWISFDTPSGTGDFAALYANLFSEDRFRTNSTNAWAFFDLGTTEPGYPIPVIAYGPPYVDNSIVSPLLDLAHEAGNPTGYPFTLDADDKVFIDYWAYLDLPLKSLVFQTWSVAAQTASEPCSGPFVGNQKAYFSDVKQWFHRRSNVNLQINRSASGGAVTGVQVKLNVVDLAGEWGGIYGDGTGHTPAPYFDNVEVYIIPGSSVGWGPGPGGAQDNFEKYWGSGINVRIDSAMNIEALDSPNLEFGDSIPIELNMDRVGGIAESIDLGSGEVRPELYLWFRVIAGPHGGWLNVSDMADQDNLDGIFSPAAGTQFFNGEEWMGMRADYAKIGGEIPATDRFAFDFHDEYFEAGDVIEYFYRAQSDGLYIETMPEYATSSDPSLRSYYRVRCLPSSGNNMLFVEDDADLLPYWLEAFTYNGYSLFDVYSTQSPGSGMHNGLASRAEASNLEQYDIIIWDSGDQESFTVEDNSTSSYDKTNDAELLRSYLADANQNVGLWLMGNQVANNIGAGSSFLSEVLAAELADPNSYYDDLTDIMTPRVFTNVDYYGNPYCWFWVDGGSPSYPNAENFSVVNVADGLAYSIMDWEVQPGTSTPGIFNPDPDGDGVSGNDQGQATPVVFNPFSYRHAHGGDCNTQNAARRIVGLTLEIMLNHQPDQSPNTVPGDIPAFTKLSGNYPNPFNPETKIDFALATHEHVTLGVFDLAGRRVRTLQDGPMAPAYHEFIWNGRDDRGKRVSSGVYFYKLGAGSYSADGKLVLIK